MPYGSDAFNEMIQESTNKIYADIYPRIPSMRRRVEMFNDIQRKAKQRSRTWRPRPMKLQIQKKEQSKDEKIH